MTVGYSHYPFDETTVLVDSGFVWDELDVDAELSPRSNLDISAIANAAWLSEGNRRLLGAAAAMVGVAKGLHVGAYVRVMGYRLPNRGFGYFSPDRFTLGEARAAYVWRRHGWWLRANGGLGAQQVGTGSPTQARMARRCHAGAQLARDGRAGARRDCTPTAPRPGPPAPRRRRTATGQ